jgi:hypothetical protein
MASDFIDCLHEALSHKTHGAEGNNTEQISTSEVSKHEKAAHLHSTSAWHILRGGRPYQFLRNKHA